MGKDRLKIVFLHRANDPYTLERIKYFVSRKYQVYSISFSTFNGRSELQSNLSGVTVIQLKKKVIDVPSFLKRFIYYSELNSILKEINPDVFHIVSALNLFYTKIKFAKIKIIENQGSDVIKSPIKYKYLIPYYKFFYKKVDGIIQDSELAQKCGIKYGASDDLDLNKIVEVGIDFGIFNNSVAKGIIRKQYNLGNRKIIFHSRGIDDIYNLDIILESILSVRKEFSDCIYILTTTIARLNKKQSKFVVKNELEKNILFVGYQDRVEKLKYFYRDADLNISVPSSDSSPFSVYESMACMTPNIVTDLPWLYSKFEPGKHLITCKVRNSEDLAKKILDVLTGKCNLDLKSTFDFIYDQINLEKENEKLEQFYALLLDRRKELSK